MRGTGRRQKPRPHVDRFIPAHAGNRPVIPNWVSVTSVHPRACGEQKCTSVCRQTQTGSSPRMRGTEPRKPKTEAYKRFIPAHAGNRHARQRLPAEPPVHPRACGEQTPFFQHTNHTGGSSPRMRGTALRRPPGVEGGRVHPRACGEQVVFGPSTNAMAGSSPRMRGTALLVLGPLAQFRFIPAHAGNSGAWS